jgi:23S rRNA-/tRNA-specific pseudouridylate synthase
MHSPPYTPPLIEPPTPLAVAVIDAVRDFHWEPNLSHFLSNDQQPRLLEPSNLIPGIAPTNAYQNVFATPLARILWEDKNLMAMHKPAGLPCLASPKTRLLLTPLVALASTLRPDLQSLEQNCEFGLLHRLDNETSGVVLFAKNERYWKHFRSLFSPKQDQDDQASSGDDDSFIKTYTAITAWHPQAESFIQDYTHWIGHDAKTQARMRIALKAQTLKGTIRGKPRLAHCQIQAVQILSPHALHPQQFCQWRIRLFTGVRHQIRLLFHWLKLPILGDPTYKGPAADRLYLHANSLSFCPSLDSPKTITVESPF